MKGDGYAHLKEGLFQNQGPVEIYGQGCCYFKSDAVGKEDEKNIFLNMEIAP